MAITFPTSPVEGQTFTDNNVVYRYSASRGYWTTISLSSITLTQLQRESFVATEGQTVYTFNYDPGPEIQVVMNGIILRETDYTATNGTSITFTEAFVAGDQVDIFFYPAAVVQFVAPTSINDLTDVTVTNPTTSDSLMYNGSQWINQTPGGGSVSTYTTIASLPLSNNNQGDLVYVSENNRLYIWNGSGWYNIALINTAPNITGGTQSSYFLATDGTPTVITLTAEDPEEIPIVWSYNISAVSLGSTATVSQNNNVFTITPSTNEADVGIFAITFTASDGVNVATFTSTFTLQFFSITSGVEPVDIVDNGINYKLYTLTSNDTFDITNIQYSVDFEYLIVAGGGGMGNNSAGAGGAGGLLTGTFSISSPQSFPVVVGAAGVNSSSGFGNSTNGGNSSVFGQTAIGGGGGGSRDGGRAGGTGGSGGGGAGGGGGRAAAGSGTSGQGFAGGGGTGDTGITSKGGGGGGAAGAGTGATTSIAGSGGPGVELSFNGTPTYYASGGAGGKTGGNGLDGLPGTGWGGYGSGGSSNRVGSDNIDGLPRPGVVMIRYQI